MRVNYSLVVSAFLASRDEQLDCVIGLVDTYRHAINATRLFNGRRHREVLDTARICEAMLIEHLMDNCSVPHIM